MKCFLNIRVQNQKSFVDLGNFQHIADFPSGFLPNNWGCARQEGKK